MADWQHTPERGVSEIAKKRRANSAKNVYYVYVLYRPDGTPCYAGKGKGHRARSNSRKSHNATVRRITQSSGLQSLPYKKILEDVTEAIAFEFECFLIQEVGRFDTGGPLVNLTAGGDGVSGHKRTPDQKAKMGDARRGKPSAITPEGRKLLSEAAKERGFTDEHKANISAAKKGKSNGPLSETHRAAIGSAHRGRKRVGKELEAIRNGFVNMSAEARQQKSLRITAALTGKKLTDEHRASISRVQKGRVRSPEFREKVRAGMLALHNNTERDARIMELTEGGLTAMQIGSQVGLSEAGVWSVQHRQRNLSGSTAIVKI